MLRERNVNRFASEEKSIERTSHSIIQFDSRKKTTSSDVTLTKIAVLSNIDDEVEEL